MPMHDHDRPPAATRHTNTAAAFTLIAAVFFIGGAVSFGTAVEKGASAATHVLAATPLVAGSVSAGVAYASRKRAATLRRAESADAQVVQGASGETPPPAA